MDWVGGECGGGAGYVRRVGIGSRSELVPGLLSWVGVGLSATSSASTSGPTPAKTPRHAEGKAASSAAKSS